jgi:hypothetical protein
LHNGCECSVSCFDGLDPEMVYKHRLNIAELTKNEQDFYLMGIARAALIDRSDKGSKRQRKRLSYTYMGKKVCLFAFLYLENITIYQLKKVRSHVMTNGVVAIEHGNSHKIPHNAFPLDLYKRVDTFLRSYLNADKQHSNKSIVLNQPLSKVYQDYKEYDKNAQQFMGYTTFRTFFKKQFPHVKLANQIVKPQTSTSNAHQTYQIIEEIVEVKKELTGTGNVVMCTDDLIYYDDGEISHEEEINN